MQTCDVAIVGAGVHGASAAFHLSTRGVKVAIFDERGPAGGPTGRSSGICRAYYTSGFLASMARKSIDMLAHFDELVGGPSGFRRTGFLWLHGPRDSAELDVSVGRLQQAGVDVSRLSAGEISRAYPMFSLDAVSEGLWEPGAGYADPVLTTTSLANAAAAAGAKTFYYTKVVSIEHDGRGFVVKTSRGDEQHAQKVLLAAGPWTRPLAALVGVDLPLTVERHVVAVIRWRDASTMPFGHADLVTGQYYCKPEGEELYCVGPLLPAEPADADSFDDDLDDDEGLQLTRSVTARVPALRDAELVGGWASLYDVSPDWQPVIGEVTEGVFVDAGTSGHGFKLAPALGAAVADLVMNEAVDPELQQFHPRRFASGQLLTAGYGAARIVG